MSQQLTNMSDTIRTNTIQNMIVFTTDLHIMGPAHHRDNNVKEDDCLEKRLVCIYSTSLGTHCFTDKDYQGWTPANKIENEAYIVRKRQAD